jgi:hypothetical protein
MQIDRTNPFDSMHEKKNKKEKKEKEKRSRQSTLE